MKRFITLSCLLLASSVATPAPADSPPKTIATSPIWSQTVAFTLPSGFVTKWEKTSGDHYQREAVPSGQTVDEWTQMVTVTGEKGLATVKGATPLIFAEEIAKGFKKACPGSFNTKALEGDWVPGYKTFAAVVSCGQSPMTNGATTETAAIVVIAGKKDYYTIQYATRTKPPSASPIDLDTAAWTARLKRLMPMSVT
ncbi:MAG: hypothetical protein JO199_11785 [Candidatus Eremiobacteraeota bacterium]|nr:hypothetical protein [Candidatus Eremiobacteraeota bacterium]